MNISEPTPSHLLQITIPWANRICIALLLSPLHYTFTAIAADSLNNCTLNYRGYCIIVSDPNPMLIVLLMSDNNLVSPFWKISAPSLILKTVTIGKNAFLLDDEMFWQSHAPQPLRHHCRSKSLFYRMFSFIIIIIIPWGSFTQM